MSMRFSYFPGCSMDATAVCYKRSTEYVAKKIGLTLSEIPDWNCCGATSAHTTNPYLALALPARNLALAEREGLHLDCVTPCAACYSRMKTAVWAARKDDKTRQEMEAIIGMPYKAEAEVYSFLDVFSQPDVMEACQAHLIRTLKGLKVACYYGCLTSRPREVTGCPDRENPMQMDKIVAMTGAECVDWDFKTECCGASHQVDAPTAARPMIERIFRNAKANGAQAIVTACPLCNLNLDMREEEINRLSGEVYDIPVYQFTELLAVCMGAGAQEIGLSKHFYPAFARLNGVLRKAGEEA